MRTDRVCQIRSKQLSACDRSLSSPCLQDLQRPYNSPSNGVSVDAKIPGFADIVKIDIDIANSSSVLLFLPAFRGGCRYVHLHAAGKGAGNRQFTRLRTAGCGRGIPMHCRNLARMARMARMARAELGLCLTSKARMARGWPGQWPGHSQGRGVPTARARPEWPGHGQGMAGSGGVHPSGALSCQDGSS